MWVEVAKGKIHIQGVVFLELGVEHVQDSCVISHLVQVHFLFILYSFYNILGKISPFLLLHFRTYLRPEWRDERSEVIPL